MRAGWVGLAFGFAAAWTAAASAMPLSVSVKAAEETKRHQSNCSLLDHLISRTSLRHYAVHKSCLSEKIIVPDVVCHTSTKHGIYKRNTWSDCKRSIVHNSAGSKLILCRTSVMTIVYAEFIGLLLWKEREFQAPRSFAKSFAPLCEMRTLPLSRYVESDPDLRVNAQSGSVANIDYRNTYWKDHTIMVYNDVTESRWNVYFQPSAMTRNQTVSSKLGLPLSGFGSLLGIAEAYADELQLPNKETSLSSTNNDKTQSQDRDGVIRESYPESFFWIFILGGLCSFALTYTLVGLWLMKKENDEKRKREQKKRAKADQAMRSG